MYAAKVCPLVHRIKREQTLNDLQEFQKRCKNESETEYIKKLIAEYCISSSLHYVNIDRTVGLIQDKSSHWCEVSELCRWVDLYGAVRKRSMSPSEVECCFRQLLYGVGYLHS